jgi:hypothetical protein
VGIVADPDRHPLDRINRFERALAWLREREPQLAEVVASLERLDFRVLKAQAYLCRHPLSVDRWALCFGAGVKWTHLPPKNGATPLSSFRVSFLKFISSSEGFCISVAF